MTPRKRTKAAVALAAAAGGAAAAGAAARRRRRERIATPQRSLTGSLEFTPTRTTTVRTEDGVTLHVEIDEPASPREGAPTVVLIHGFTVCLKSWVFQRRALTEAGYRVVSYDHRGHGSSGAGSPDHTTIAQLGRDLRRILDTVVPDEQVVLVGHSMGGITIMAFGETSADQIGERVLGAAFVATSAGGEGGLITLGYGAFVGRMIERYGPGALTRLGRQEAALRKLRGLGRNLEDYFTHYYSFSSNVSKTLIRFTADLAFETSFQTISQFIATFNDHDRRGVLGVWGAVPTLVITADNDRLTPLDHGRTIAEAIPGSDHVIVSNAGHVVMLEYPDLVNTEILELLAEVGP
ncbi:MAG: alpha/beta hydrolase [Actinomycetia bacterium]|nr:alpha/beta hydrolase [Actinomycetes bacterium]